MASLNPKPNFSYTYPGNVGKQITFDALASRIGLVTGIAPNIKSLEQWTTTNPDNFKGIVREGTTACTPTRVDIGSPSNQTPKVHKFQFATESCVDSITTDQSGDYTYFQDQLNTGMAGYRGLAGYEGVFANNIKTGMANDNFMLAQFADPNTTDANSILDTAEMQGMWTQIIANSTTTSGGAFNTAFEGTEIPGSLATPDAFTGDDIVASIDSLIDESYITLRQRISTSMDVRLRMTPNSRTKLIKYLSGVTGSDRNFGWIQTQGNNLQFQYRGFIVEEDFGWYESLNAPAGTYFNDLGSTTKELILLYAKNNCWTLTDNLGDTDSFETNYDPRTRTVLYDGSYMLGSHIIDFGLCAFARQSLS